MSETNIPDGAREAVATAIRDHLKRTTLPADPLTGFKGWGASEYEIAEVAYRAAAPFLVAAERQRLHAVEALCDEAERDRIPGMPGAWVNTHRIRAALVSPVSDDTGGTK